MINGKRCPLIGANIKKINNEDVGILGDNTRFLAPASDGAIGDKIVAER